jgi:hypothetical protein
LAVGDHLRSQEPLERADDRTPLVFADGDDDAVEVGEHGRSPLGRSGFQVRATKIYL